MGADGGVACIFARRVEDVEAIRRLLAPFDVLDHKGASHAEASRDEWLEANYDPRMIDGLYGTDLPDCATIDDLGEVCDELRDLLEDPTVGVGNDATFGDLLMERETVPAWLREQRRYGGSVRHWLAAIDPRRWRHGEPLVLPTEGICAMKVRDWIAELASLVVCEEDTNKRLRAERPEKWRWTPTARREETWT